MEEKVHIQYWVIIDDISRSIDNNHPNMDDSIISVNNKINVDGFNNICIIHIWILTLPGASDP